MEINFFFFLSFGVMCLSFHGGPHSGLSKAPTSNEQGEMKGPNVWTKIAWQPTIVVVFIYLCVTIIIRYHFCFTFADLEVCDFITERTKK